MLQPVAELRKRGMYLFLRVHGCTDGGKQMRMLRCNDGVTGQFQSTDKSSLQFGKEMKRASEKGHIAPDGLTTGQARNSLVDDCLENGSCQVLFCSSFIDERLNVGFGKDTASGCNGINGFVMLCIFIQAAGIGL